MSLTTQEVAKVARLARIRMNDEELERTREKINTIIGFVEQLSEVNTDNVEPLSSPVSVALPLRADVVNDGNCAEAVLANAPEEMENFFVVPKVVE